MSHRHADSWIDLARPCQLKDSASENHYPQCCWGAINNWILRSVLNNKFSVLTFPRSVTCLMSIEQSICTKKMVHLQSMSNVIISLICFNKSFASRILVHLVWPLQFTSSWAIQQWKSSMHKIQIKLLSFDFFYLPFLMIINMYHFLWSSIWTFDLGSLVKVLLAT